MTKDVQTKFVRIACLASAGLAVAGLNFVSNAFAQEPPPPPAATAAVPGTAEAERVIVTGSNIPTAEETGPNPVDTYRPQDIEKLGIRSATDLSTFLPQEAGGNINLNIGNGGDGTVQFNLRGLLPRRPWF
jgi:outer membrane receptor protein involved in Fe transport